MFTKCFLNACQYNLYSLKFQYTNKGKRQNIADSLDSLASRRLVYNLENSRKRSANTKR